MKKLFFPILFISVFAFISCEKVEVFNTSVVGVWTNPQYNDSIIVYERSNILPENEYGLEIKADGTIIERKNAGWCGTPPIAYDDFTGKWTGNDSIINIEVMFWGGTEKLKWKIVSFDDNKLTVKQLKSEYIYKGF